MREESQSQGEVCSEMQAWKDADIEENLIKDDDDDFVPKVLFSIQF